MKHMLRAVCIAATIWPGLILADESIPDARGAEALWRHIEQITEENLKAQNQAHMLSLDETRQEAPASAGLSPARLYQLRELVLEFYEKYPADFRAALLRDALLTFGNADPVEPVYGAVLEHRQRATFKAEASSNLDGYLRRLTEATRSRNDELRLPRTFELLGLHLRGLNASPAQQREIYKRLMASPNPAVRDRAEGRLRFLDLHEQPLQLKLPTADDGVMDLARLRGKVVLLDIWSLNCSSCIAAMPRMQTLYEKYRARGLEVVGVFLASNENEKVNAEEVVRGRAVMRAKGAHWTEAVISGRQKVGDFMQLYSFSGVPQVWLFDKNGRLIRDVSSSADFTGSRAGNSSIEREIERLLAAGPDAAASLSGTRFHIYKE